jgi:hypothetical protein
LRPACKLSEQDRANLNQSMLGKRSNSRRRSPASEAVDAQRTCRDQGASLASEPDQLERLRERLDALGPAPRTGLLHVLTIPDFDRGEVLPRQP